MVKLNLKNATPNITQKLKKNPNATRGYHFQSASLDLLKGLVFADLKNQYLTNIKQNKIKVLCIFCRFAKWGTQPQPPQASNIATTSSVADYFGAASKSI